jgi:hypothetical protein
MATVKKAQLGSLIRAASKAGSKAASKAASSAGRLKGAAAVAAKKAPAKAFKKDIENPGYFGKLMERAFGEIEKGKVKKVQKNRSGGKIKPKASNVSKKLGSYKKTIGVTGSAKKKK